MGLAVKESVQLPGRELRTSWVLAKRTYTLGHTGPAVNDGHDFNMFDIQVFYLCAIKFRLDYRATVG